MNHRVIAFHYTLTDPTGKLLDSSAGGEPLAFLEGAGQIIPGLETHLRTMKPGDKRQVLVPAKDAYGAKNDSRHPLAGMDLTFDIEITGIRDATKEELAHGHVHGAGGHHH